MNFIRNSTSFDHCHYRVVKGKKVFLNANNIIYFITVKLFSHYNFSQPNKLNVYEETKLRSFHTHEFVRNIVFVK